MGADSRVIETSRRTSKAPARTRAVELVRAHPVLTVFVLALIVRVIAVFVFAPLFSGSYVLDDGTYVDMAQARASGNIQSWDDYTFSLFDATATFMIPLTLLFKVFGPNEVIAGLFVALLGAGTAALVTRIGLEGLDVARAMAAGLILAFLPSQILWSSLVLKDAAVWVVLAGLALVVAIAARTHGPRLLAFGVGAAGLLFLLAHLRMHTVIVAAWALMMASWVGDKKGRLLRVAGAVVIAVSIPWQAGAGPAGMTFVTNSGNLEERRISSAHGARTAVVDTDLAPDFGPDSTSEGEGGEGTGAPGDTTGDGSEGTDAGEPDAGDGSETGATVFGIGGTGGGDAFDPGLEHLPRGIAVMLFEPVPWSSNETLSFRLAQAETILWYPILALALVGLFYARRHLRVVLYPVVAGTGILLTYALAEGNIGTAYRHRGEFVWVAALLAGFGLVQVRKWRLARRTRKQSSGS